MSRLSAVQLEGVIECALRAHDHHDRKFAAALNAFIHCSDAEELTAHTSFAAASDTWFESTERIVAAVVVYRLLFDETAYQSTLETFRRKRSSQETNALRDELFARLEPRATQYVQ